MTKCASGSVIFAVSFENIQVCAFHADLLPCECLSCNEVNVTGKQKFN